MSRKLEALAAPAQVGLVGGIFVAIVVADFATRADLALRALYVLPVGLAGWLLGRRPGVVVGMLAAAATVAFDLRSGLWVTHRAFVYSDAVMRVLTYAGCAHILDRLRRAHRLLDTLAHNDALTGIANVRGFREAAQRELNRAARLGSPFTLAQIDLDGFKAVNDSCGHAEGDRILVAVGRVLGSGRVLDVAARLGGDEFALLLTDTNRAEAEVVIARVRERLAEAMREGAWPVTFSVGVATFLSAPESLDRALAIADALLYEVKRSSKDAVRFAESGETLVSNTARRLLG
ncbi:MAG: GGDEF domain-containing protein [Polyangiales bacterium]